MTDPQVPAVPGVAPGPRPSFEAGPRWALLPLTAAPHDIAVATVVRMLDPQGQGVARALTSGGQFPYGARPVLVTSATVFGSICVERQLRAWHSVLPRPWLVLIADVPAPAPVEVRYRIRALEGRLAGVAHVPYLRSLRVVESAEAAMKTKDVQRAAAKLRGRMEGK